MELLSGKVNVLLAAALGMAFFAEPQMDSSLSGVMDLLWNEYLD